MFEKITKWTAATLSVLIAVIAFVGVLLMFRAVSEVLWSEKAAGWAQAIGSIVAIGIAFHTGSRQSRDALLAIEHSFNLAELRKYAAFSVIAQAARLHAITCHRVFHETGFSFIAYEIAQFDGDRKSLIQAIEAIPVHEVGSYAAVSALVGMKVAMLDLDRAMLRADAHVKGLGSTIESDWQNFDTSVIRLCCEVIEFKANNLIEAMAPGPTESRLA